MTYVIHDFGEVYLNFVTVLGTRMQRLLPVANVNQPPQEPIHRSISETLRDALAEAKSPAAVVAVSYASSQIDPTSRNLLADELVYIADQYVASTAAPTRAEVHDWQTGKDSILDLLKSWLPEWLKRLLKILNEILAVLRPAS